jgi:hypothetical protein
MDATPGAATASCRRADARPLGVYKPRRPQALPLFRLVQDHLRTQQMVYHERFAPTYGEWRPVIREVAEKFLACGILHHGFARVRCDARTHENLLAFSCKCRYFCPSCHARRLAPWDGWLEASLLALVPHRQVVVVRKVTLSEQSYRYCFSLSDQTSNDGSPFSVSPARAC